VSELCDPARGRPAVGLLRSHRAAVLGSEAGVPAVPLEFGCGQAEPVSERVGFVPLEKSAVTAVAQVRCESHRRAESTE